MEHKPHEDDEETSGQPTDQSGRVAEVAKFAGHLHAPEAKPPTPRPRRFELPNFWLPKPETGHDDEDDDDDEKEGADDDEEVVAEPIAPRTEFVLPPSLAELSLPPYQEAAQPDALRDDTWSGEGEVPLVTITAEGARVRTPAELFEEQFGGRLSPAAEVDQAPVEPETTVVEAAQAHIDAYAGETLTIDHGDTIEPEPLTATSTAHPGPVYAPRHASPVVAPHTPNVPPIIPNSPNNNPPVPPNVRQGFNMQQPPFNPNVGPFNTPPTPNIQPTTRIENNTTIVERRRGEPLAVIVGSLAWLANRRRRGENQTTTNNLRQTNRLAEQLHAEQLRQAERQRLQAEDLNRLRMQPATNASETNVIRPVEQQRYAEPTPQATRFVRPTGVEQRSPVMQIPGVETAVPGAQEQEQQAFATEAERHIRSSAWHNVVMKVDEQGREVVDTDAQYGRGFQQERRQEVAPAAPQTTQASVGSSTAMGSGTVGPIPLPGSVSPSLPSGMTTPSLSQGQSAPRDVEHRLPAPHHPVRDMTITIVLWLLIAAAAFVLVSGARLLF